MVTLNVCVGSACHLKGSYNIIHEFQQFMEENELHEKIDFKAAFCMKECQNKGICVQVNEEKYNVEAQNAREFFQKTVLPLV